MTFEKIYKTYHSPILRYYKSKINSVEDAEELASSVMMKVYIHFDNYDETKSNWKTWIFNIATNHLIDYFRKKKLNTVSIHHQTSFDDEDKESSIMIKLQCTSLNPSQEYVSKEQHDILTNAINSIKSEKLKTIAKLYFIDDLKYSEISSILNISIGNIKSRIFRARNVLQDKLKNVEI